MICKSCKFQFNDFKQCPHCAYSVDQKCLASDVIIFDRYKIQKKLGNGRLGNTYKAIDLRFDMDVVLKTLDQSLILDTESGSAFIFGMQSFMQITHPMMTKILDVFCDNGTYFVVSEFLEGVSLKDLLANRKKQQKNFVVSDVYPILRQFGSFMVESGIEIHGSISLENIWILPGNLKVLDAGLAVNLPPQTIGTCLLLKKATKGFAAPEIIKGSPVTMQSDVFALGVLIGEMLTHIHFDGQPESYKQEDPNLPLEVESVLRRALLFDPRGRHKNTEELLDSIADIAGLPTPLFTKPSFTIVEDSVMKNLASKNTAKDQNINNDNLTEKTVQVSMQQVISAHMKTGKPDAAKSLQDISVVTSSKRENTKEIDSDIITGHSNKSSASEAVKKLEAQANEAVQKSTEELIKRSVSLKGINPRFVRAAHKLESERLGASSKKAAKLIKNKATELDGIDPRFLRAAARLEEARISEVPNAHRVKKVKPPKSSKDATDWRNRVGTEKDDSVISFLSPPVLNNPGEITGFPKSGQRKPSNRSSS